MPSLHHSYISCWAISAHPGCLFATLYSPDTSEIISAETSRSTMIKLLGSVMMRWADMVRRSGEPGPAPTSVIRPPEVGWILGGLVEDLAALMVGEDDDCRCSSWICLSFL